MPRLIRTPQANEDLLEIWDYIAVRQQQPAMGDHVLRELDKVAQMLAENPLIGQTAEQYRKGLRMYPKWNYIIFYEPLDDAMGGGIRVYRILHGARSLEGLL